MITALASALHGHNTFSKGYIMAVHAFAYAGLTFLLTSTIWLAGAVFLLCVAFWYTLRSGENAHLEMQRMDTINEPHPSFMGVVKGHYCLGWLTALALEFFNYSTKLGKKLGWEHQAAQTGMWGGKPVRVLPDGRVHPDDRPFWDCRRPAEIATGLTFDIVLTVIIVVSLFI